LKAGVEAAAEGGLTEAQVAAAITGGLITGSDALTRGQIALATDHRSGITHATWRRGKPAPGLTYFMEFAGSYGDYCVPVIRTLVRGRPPPAVRGLDAAARAALFAVLENLRADVVADDVARRALAAIGPLDDRIYFHGNFGYPVGLGQRTTWMDNPPFNIVRGSTRVVKAGMAFHIPAAMILVGEVGVGHSHTVVVQEHGLEVLTAE
jgi:Xaa-Pro dipeptidase